MKYFLGFLMLGDWPWTGRLSRSMQKLKWSNHETHKTHENKGGMGDGSREYNRTTPFHFRFRDNRRRKERGGKAEFGRSARIPPN